MKVSVIVPVYNTQDYLRKCLDSLLQQDIDDYEVIVVNDGSPDESQKIIDEYKKYPIIKSYVKVNGGLSDARNYGLDRAEGEYIAFVDSDDYIRCDMLSKMYDKAKKDDLDIVVCDSINVYPSGQEVLVHSNLHYSDDEVRNYLIAAPMACTRMFKRNILDSIRFKAGIYYEDLHMCPKVVNLTKKIGFVEEGLYYYYQRENSIMKQKKFNNKLLDIFTVLQSNKDMLEKDYPLEIEYMYITHLLRTASLRFLEYENSKLYLDKINDIFRNEYPNWRRNTYYKKSSYKLKLICNLSYMKMYGLLKLIKKITNK